MARKDNSKNPLQISMRAISLPRGTSPKKYLTRLLQHIKTGDPLPPSWDVEISWRNPGVHSGRSKNWQTDDFESAVSESSDGFNSIVAEAIHRKLRRLPLEQERKRPSRR
jgi:hypothetical protein